MPYNFELTFTQPILAKLDAGKLKDARDWANTITDAYLQTIKLGLPQGVPLILPAPGLNPTAPPPYPISISGYNTANSRRPIMYNIIYSYFKAKEIKLNKGSLEDIGRDIAQLQRVIKSKKSKLKSTQQQAKNLKQELKEVKKILPSIIATIKEEVKADLKLIDDLLSSAGSLDIDVNDVSGVFAFELNLINRLKNLNITDINDVIILTNDLNTLQNNFESVDSSKRYFQSRLISIGTSMLQWINGLNNLPILLSKVQRTSDQYKKIKLYLNQVEFISKKIAFIEKQIEELQYEVTQKLKTKLEELKNKLIKTKASTKKSRSSDLFKVVKKIVLEDKKKVQAEIKKVRQRVDTINSKLTVVSKLGLRIVAVSALIEKEIALLSKDLKSAKNTIRNNVDRAGEVVKLREYLAEAGLQGYANVLSNSLVQGQSDFETFKSKFEARELKYTQIYKELKLIATDINTLLKEDYPKLYTKINKLGVSLKSLCDFVLNALQPLIDDIKTTITNEKVKLELYVTKTLSKSKKQLEKFLVSLIPVKSNVVDPVEKAKARKEKLIAYKEYINKAKKLSTLAPQVGLGTKGLIKLLNNIKAGRYTYADNSGEVLSVVNALYTIKGFNATPSTLSELAKEKKQLLSQLDKLIVVDLIFKLIKDSFAELKSGDGFSLFENDVNRLKGTIPQSEFESLQQVLKLISSPPNNVNDLYKAVESVNLEVLNIIDYKNRLLSVEKYYLIRSKQAVQTALDGYEKYKIENESVKNTLLKFKRILSKEDSFILFGLKVLKAYLNDFIILVEGKLKSIFDTLESKIQLDILKNSKQFENLSNAIKRKLVNLDALAMSAVFGLAARLFWTGATWLGPTGINHVVLNIGFFKPIKAKMNDGASAMINQIASSYEKQVQLMQGLIIPPPNLLIPPIPFAGYK